MQVGGYIVRVGDRIAQLVPVKSLTTFEVEESEVLPQPFRTLFRVRQVQAGNLKSAKSRFMRKSGKRPSRNRRRIGATGPVHGTALRIVRILAPAPKERQSAVAPKRSSNERWMSAWMKHPQYAAIG